MAEYKLINAAGNKTGQNVFKIRFDGSACSDNPQIQAWDDYGLNTTDIESLAGTPVGGNLPLLAAADTSTTAVANEWATGLTMTPGPAPINRLRGEVASVKLGSTPPVNGDERTFQLAFALTRDMTPGVSGHMPVVAFKTFYAGAAPAVSVHANLGDEGTPVWQQMTTAEKGVSTPQTQLNTIIASGQGGTAPATINTVPSAVTKPTGDEKWAEGQWLQTEL